MFDIKIGTLIPAEHALKMIPQLNPLGFESYELNFGSAESANTDLNEFSKQINEVLEGREISALGFYCNPIKNDDERSGIANLIENAHLFNCDCIGTFAGGNEKNVPDTIPDFVRTFKPLVELAEDKGVKIGLENCGDGWNGDTYNIAFCPEAWELIFNEITSDNIGLEWEPCHALMALIDPIAQLRKWAKKVVHVHGKDATVAYDVIREYGIRGIHEFAWNRTPGFGDTNWANIVTILIQNGFEGAIDIEGYHDPVHYDDMEWTAQVTALNYLKRCRGGIQYTCGPCEYRGFKGKRK